ncbi:MAG: UTP--glucose-1-phosphate uridylyltransferase [Gemmataceae bacterium]
MTAPATDAQVLFQRLLDKLAPIGQTHVLRFWHELSDEQRRCLAAQIEQLDLAWLAQMQERGLRSQLSVPPPDSWQPPEVIGPARTFDQWEYQEQVAQLGEASLKAGEVAILLVAGGQGTRLGWHGPKGTFPIGPISGKSLFQIHAEKVLKLARRYDVPLPLCIMTSPANDQLTRDFFQQHHYFGLPPEQVHFFVQDELPVVEYPSGRLLLADRHRIATSPNGHGGVLTALQKAHLLDRLHARGIRRIFYFQVDNPLVRIADPFFIGHHLERGAEMSLKVVIKNDPLERVGNVVCAQGRYYIVEYSDLPEMLARRRLPSGELLVRYGSIAIHLFELEFLRRLCSRPEPLPCHCALKTTPYLDEHGQLRQPQAPNAVKFETFIFDALPEAQRVVILETSRAEEFEPLKNAAGENSPATVRQALTHLYADWLSQAGVAVPRRPDGSPAFPIEISPLYALDAEELRDKVAHLHDITGPLYLEDRTDLQAPASHDRDSNTADKTRFP